MPELKGGIVRTWGAGILRPYEEKTKTHPHKTRMGHPASDGVIWGMPLEYKFIFANWNSCKGSFLWGSAMSFSTSYLPRVWLGSQGSEKFWPATIRPLSAHVKLTENCQAKCISCDYWKTRWNDGIDTSKAIDLVNQIAELGIGSLRFTGGEPLLRKDFFEVLQQAKTSSFKHIILQTNGLLLKKLNKEINASPISNISVSIDGLKDTNDHIRGIRGYFELAMEGIRLMKNKHRSIAIRL